jgi:imidazole glycerol phosphate synthase glutamine amidotransferase subunit
MIAILDYGAGNLRSVENTLAEIGADYTLVQDAAGLQAADKIILPGVGHFGQMMRALDAMNVRGVLRERIDAGVPFFGICLGMHALFEGSEEAPGQPGLGYSKVQSGSSVPKPGCPIWGGIRLPA